ncbi:Clp protease ClpP [Paracoccus bogoriensis]|uniref:head maturation protease, ClpP-related n=1 Tax=Paracoccus bogoriensis TaxID=242065 RepID=UPI001C6626F8|nr:head maturation protease, ClpP-related [Paracoccus bogoriensis]MBW7057647.1 Clp protease ClpP [Paracoccus bogoriensis]
MAGWYTIRARDGGAEVAIHDEIGAEGVSAKGFLAELGAIPDGAPILVRINSPGGSVFDAVAIHNALKRHAGTVTVWIDGIAASAASYVAMAGDEIVMPENAFLMIHDPAGLVMGTAADMRAMAETLDKIAATMVRGYAARAGRPEDEIAALMAAETWFDAEEALAAGLATRIAEPVRIAARFDIARFRNAPPALLEAIEAGADPAETVPDGNGSDEPAAEGDAADDDAGAADRAQKPDSAGADVSEGNSPPGAAEGSGAVVSAAHDAAPDTGRDASAIRAEAMARARAVVDLCCLAGLPQMASRFLAECASLDEVRAALLAARAEAAPEIAPHHPQPGRSTAARPWGEIVARTFKLKG